MATSTEPESSTAESLPDGRGDPAAVSAPASVAHAPPAPGASADPAPAAAPAVTPRVLVGELTSAVSGLLLLIVLFVTQWYGVAGVPDPSAARPAISTAESGWEALSLARWVVVATALVALGSVLLHASQRRHGTKTDTSRLITGLGLLSSLLLVYRVLIVLPTGGRVIDQKFGALVGLACACGVALGGYQSIAEHRLRARIVVQRPRRRSRLTSGRRSR